MLAPSDTTYPEQYGAIVEVRILKAVRHVASRRCEQMTPLIIVPDLLSCSDCPLVAVFLRQIPVCLSMIVCMRKTSRTWLVMG